MANGGYPLLWFAVGTSRGRKRSTLNDERKGSERFLAFNNWDSIPVRHHHSMQTFHTEGTHREDVTHEPTPYGSKQGIGYTVHTSAAVCTGISSNPATCVGWKTTS